MGQMVSRVLVIGILVGTTAAFAYTEFLKLQPAPIFGTKVEPKLISPVCGCDSASASISFRVRERDVIDVTMVNSDDDVVATLVRALRVPAGRVEVEFKGRDADHLILPEGKYRPRIKLREAKVTTVLPNPIEIDVTPPLVEEWSAGPTVLSPDGDGRRDVLTVRYRLSEPARGLLLVDNKRRVRKLRVRTEDVIRWSGRLDGRGYPPGTYGIVLAASDRAGNVSAPTKPKQIRVRYVALGRKRVVVTSGQRFAIRVSADARRVRWKLGARSGSARPGTLFIRAPRSSGRFTLVVSANNHHARAAVFVRSR